MSQSKKLLTVQQLTMNRLRGRKKYRVNTITNLKVEQFVDFFNKLHSGEVVYETLDGRILDFLETNNGCGKIYRRRSLI